MKADVEREAFAFESIDLPPEETWLYIAGLLGFPVMIGGLPRVHRPWITWGLAAGITIVGVLGLSSSGSLGAVLGLDPADPWRFCGLTWITTALVHADVFHLAASLYFLMAVGTQAERVLGWRRTAALIVASLLAGDLLQLAFANLADAPLVGSGAAIWGCLAYAALAFPEVRIGFRWLPSWSRGSERGAWLRIPARGALLLWAAIQVAYLTLGFDLGASWAQVGGVATGAGLWWLESTSGRRGSSRERVAGSIHPPAR